MVDITATSTQQGNSNGFFSTPSQTTQDEGAGVVYNKQGDILTDEHVVAERQQRQGALPGRRERSRQGAGHRPVDRRRR